MKALAANQSSYAASIWSAPSFLRIAIPSWRAIGIQYQPEPEEQPASLSREEIQTLFQGELSPNARKRNPLTDWEMQEKSLAEKLRLALYPEQMRDH